VSRRHRRDRLAILSVALAVPLAVAGTLLIGVEPDHDPLVRLIFRYGFLILVGAALLLFRAQLRRGESERLILESDSVTVRRSHGEETLPIAKIAGLQLREAGEIAVEGSALPWLSQVGGIVLKSADPETPDLELPTALAVDPAFDEWIAGLPVLGAPVLEGRGEMTVRAAGAHAVDLGSVSYSSSVAVALLFLMTLCFALQLIGAFGGDGRDLRMTSEALLELGGARADLVYEKGDWVRLISAAFLYRDPVHFFSTVFLTVIVADILGRRLGSPLLIGVFALCAVASVTASLSYAPEPFVTVGASGALFGMVGFLFGGLVRPTAIEINRWRWLLILVCFTYLALPSDHLLADFIGHSRFGPDYGGNLAGLLAGVIAALAMAMIPRREPRMVA
jgi:membrane associated rhomboid family serine protease